VVLAEMPPTKILFGTRVPARGAFYSRSREETRGDSPYLGALLLGGGGVLWEIVCEFPFVTGVLAGVLTAELLELFLPLVCAVADILLITKRTH
jgi:hypothetical protein